MAMSYGLAWDRLTNQGYADVQSTGNEYADYTIWHQLITAPDTLRKRTVLALSEIMVVSSTGIDFEWRNHAMAHYWDTLCKHAFGNYRELLEAITLNVAMGYYLNTKGNLKELTRTVGVLLKPFANPMKTMRVRSCSYSPLVWWNSIWDALPSWTAAVPLTRIPPAT